MEPVPSGSGGCRRSRLVLKIRMIVCLETENVYLWALPRWNLNISAGSSTWKPFWKSDPRAGSSPSNRRPKPQAAFKLASDLQVLETWRTPAPGAGRHGNQLSGQQAAKKAPSRATSKKRKASRVASSGLLWPGGIHFTLWRLQAMVLAAATRRKKAGRAVSHTMRRRHKHTD